MTDLDGVSAISEQGVVECICGAANRALSERVWLEGGTEREWLEGQIVELSDEEYDAGAEEDNDDPRP